MSNLVSLPKFTQVWTCVFPERTLKAWCQVIVVACSSLTFIRCLRPGAGRRPSDLRAAEPRPAAVLTPLALSPQCARLDAVVSKYPAANAYTLPSRFVSKKDFSNCYSSMFQLPSFGKVLKTETPAPNHYNVRTLRMLTNSILKEWFTKIKGRKQELGEIVF